MPNHVPWPTPPCRWTRRILGCESAREQRESQKSLRFRAQGNDETYDDEYSSLERLEGLDKSSERLSIEIIRRFVYRIYHVSELNSGEGERERQRRTKNDDVRSSPSSSGQNDLDLLSSGKTSLENREE